MLFTADFSGHGVAVALNTFRLDAIIKEMEVPSAALEVEGVLELARNSVPTRPDQPLGYLPDRFDRAVEQPLNDDLTAVWLSH